MICTDCRIAGELNARGLAIRAAGNSAKAEEAFAAAEAVHDKCSSKGCFCQHVVGLDLHRPGGAA